MAIILDLVFGSDAEDRHATPERRKEIGEVNTKSQFIGDAFLFSLRQEKFDLGRFRKLIIELRTQLPTTPDGIPMTFEYMLDVVRYNVVFDFRRYMALSAHDKCNELLFTISHGISEISRNFQLAGEAGSKAASAVASCEFLYIAPIGTKIIAKKLGWTGQLFSASSPLASPKTLIGAQISEITTGEAVGSCTFLENIRLHQHPGQLKLRADGQIAFSPKNRDLPIIVRQLERHVRFATQMRNSLAQPCAGE